MRTTQQKNNSHLREIADRKIMRQQILEIARSYVGTPYHHQGRVRGAGVDCCGLIIAVARDLELLYQDVSGYNRWGNGVKFLAEFDSQCDRTSTPEPGDILVFRIRKHPQHCGILANQGDTKTLIHAYQSFGRVAEHDLTEWWESRIVAAYQFRPCPD